MLVGAQEMGGSCGSVVRPLMSEYIANRLTLASDITVSLWSSALSSNKQQ